MTTMLGGAALLACIAALSAEPPYPPSAAITALHWDDQAKIIRSAPGSDNWPLTWADDDQLYTGYGDGRGFAPMVPSKLSLGFARIGGTPPDHAGVNIRSTGEQTGDGKKGKKANGILMVDGRLYAWLFHADRNGGHSQLAWSDDHAASWTFGDWTFPEFGLLSFVNYGKNYEGARDEYVYLISHDGPIAHEPADRMILARVPGDRMTERSAYTFLERRDANGRPVWTSEISRRGANVVNPGRCLRSSMVYSPGLGRYLYWQQLPNMAIADHGDTRFEGGFGIYDAPEPWGPWTTVAYTEKWDVGPGERGEFPTKWMSADGKTAWLAFSGDDSFSVRKATFIVADGPPR
jgi:hypothetical protein